MRTVTVLLALIISTTSLADLYLVQSGNTWKEIKSLDEIPVGAVVRIGRLSTSGSPNPNPDPNPDPVPSDRVEKITEATEKYVSKKLEAQALLTTIRLFKRPDTNFTNFERGMDRAIDTLGSSSLLPDNQLQAWWDAVKPLANGTYNLQYVKDLDSGVTGANIPSSVTKTVDLLVLGADGNSAVEGSIERLDLGGLLQLIQLIFEILKNLGIFGG